MRRRIALCCLAVMLSWPLGLSAQSLRDETLRNDTVRNALDREGDDGRTPRYAEHWAYPETNPITLDAMMDALRRDGFAAEPAQGNGGVKFGHTVVVAGREFDLLTFGLERFCAERGWNYDGWETVVVRKGASG